MKRLIGFLALACAGAANAGIITSTADPALAGATFQNFDAVAPGEYASLSLPGVTIVGNGAPLTIDSTQGAYGMGGLNLNNRYSTPTSFDLVFDSPVTAFGIYGGAVNNPWVYTAYDSANNVLESITTSGACCSPMFYGIANSNGIARATLDGAGDWAVFDNLYFTAEASNNLPEPGSVALFGLALAGLVATRRKPRLPALAGTA